MEAWTEQHQAAIRTRIEERLAEAASERLASADRPAAGSVRRRVGRLLITAGRRVAGEPAASGSPAARTPRTPTAMAA